MSEQFVPILKSLGATSYLAKGNQKHVFETNDRDTVCKMCITQSNEELGKLFRELMYRLNHPEICCVPREIHIHNPRYTEVVIVVWKEDRANQVGHNSVSVHTFIDQTREMLNRHGFRDLHVKNVGRFRDRLKWFDL